MSGGSTAEEAIELTNPVPGSYTAVVEGFADAAGTTSTPFTFHSFVVPTTPTAFDFAVTPANATVTPGQQLTLAGDGLRADGHPAVPRVGRLPSGTGTTVLVN